MGACPCPHCLLPKASFDLLGLARDMQDRLTNLRTYSLAGVAVAHDFIYTYGSTVDSLRVQTALGEGSWLPTMVRLLSE
jgi:hypothetical protein